MGNAKDDVGDARLELLPDNGVFAVSNFKAGKYAEMLLICVVIGHLKHSHMCVVLIIKGMALLFCTVNYASKTSHFESEHSSFMDKGLKPLH